MNWAKRLKSLSKATLKSISWMIKPQTLNRRLDSWTQTLQENSERLNRFRSSFKKQIWKSVLPVLIGYVMTVLNANVKKSLVPSVKPSSVLNALNVLKTQLLTKLERLFQGLLIKLQLFRLSSNCSWTSWSMCCPKKLRKQWRSTDSLIHSPAKTKHKNQLFNWFTWNKTSTICKGWNWLKATSHGTGNLNMLASAFNQLSPWAINIWLEHWVTSCWLKIAHTKTKHSSASSWVN